MSKLNFIVCDKCGDKEPCGKKVDSFAHWNGWTPRCRFDFHLCPKCEDELEAWLGKAAVKEELPF